MKINFKHTRITTAVIVALTLSSCARFENRMQANGSFEYKQATLTTPYKTGEFSNDEARSTFAIPELTEQQKAVGFEASDVDVRPPTQPMSVIDGVLLESTEDGTTKVWFNAFTQDEDIQEKVWSLLESYLAQFDTQFVGQSNEPRAIETGVITEIKTYGKYFNVNTFTKETSYKFTTEKPKDGHSVALIVNALSYKETNDEAELKVNLVGNRKHDIEVRFVNALLAYAYQVKQSEQFDSTDTQPLAIKLGFDDNHQNTWIVDNNFEETWSKLPALFTLLNFEMVEDDKNLGYFLLNYKKPLPSYWEENDLQPFDLIPNEYYVQLGEVTGGETSLLWLDEDKKPLSDQMITDIYISITKHLRSGLIESDKQTKEF